MPDTPRERPTLPLQPRALAIYRHDRGVTQRAVAAYLGLTSGCNLSRIETGRKRASQRMLDKILDGIDALASDRS